MKTIKEAPSKMIRWHHSLHQITGEMCKFFGHPPGPGELTGWSVDLRAVADEMETGVQNAEMVARYKKGSKEAIRASAGLITKEEVIKAVTGIKIRKRVRRTEAPSDMELYASNCMTREENAEYRKRNRVPVKKSKRSLGRRKAKG